MDIEFVTKVPYAQKTSIENLLFFNEQQEYYVRQIEKSIETFGMPAIINSSGLVKIKVGENESNAIYAVHNGQIVGIIIYLADSEGSLFVVHIVVRPEYSNEGEHGHYQVVSNLIAKVIDIARQQKLRSVKLFGPKCDIVSITIKKS